MSIGWFKQYINLYNNIMRYTKEEDGVESTEKNCLQHEKR
jgi:hypothetical protein